MMKTRRRVVGAAITFCGLSTLGGFGLAAQPAPRPSASEVDVAYDELAAAHRIHEATISPDGGKVAWVELRVDGGSGLRTSLQVATLGDSTLGAAPRWWGRDNARVRHLAWSPDGSRLVFLSDAETPGQMQVYVADTIGSSVRSLTHLTGELGMPRFSPDGRTVAFLFTENARAAAGPVAAKPVETGVIGERMDVQRIAVVDTESGETRVVSPPSLYVHEFDWSPDGKRIAVTAAPPPGDDGWYVVALYALDVATGEPTTLLTPSTQIGCPRDRKSVV